MSSPIPAEENSDPAKPSLKTILSRSIRLNCPRCGNGRLFRSYFTMHERCESCQLQYERGPGYYLGSTYINYAFTSVLMTISYVLLKFVFGYDNKLLLIPLGFFIVVFPLLFFRFARALWLGMDCLLDSSAFNDDP